MSEKRSGATPPDGESVARLFEIALETPAEEIEALLARECEGLPDLRAEVESLLVAHRRAAGFLERAPAGPGDEASSAGADVGPYRLLDRIGQGGMGTVYLAERADGAFEQQVALKLIRHGIGSEWMRQRFLRERQIQARLEHPNIARLLDGGVTADGWPYFAMELVRGTPVTEYCDRRRLSIAARLELFDQACRAVQHAHANLVVHRDLKPPNMLVTDDGVLKLLDFGIAKVLSGEPDEGNALTRAGFQPLTPDYAAPEQLRGEEATTATDVYVLGIVLHELLTGRRPASKAARRDGFESRASDLVPLPEAFAHAAASRARKGSPASTAEEVAAARSTTPARLQRELAGDLDAVVQQALQTDPRRRYGTVEALAEDLHRCLTHQAVSARPPTFRYRAGKVVRRHRVAVAAAAAALVSLLAGLGASLWQARVAARERDRAEAAAAEASEVASYFVDLFGNVDPEHDEGGAITARELLDRGAQQLEVTLVDRPLTRARLQEAIAGVYLHLRQLEPAAELLESAVSAREKAAGADDPTLFEPLLSLGAIQYRAYHYSRADRTLARALRLAESAGLTGTPGFARAQVLAGNLSLGRSDWTAAEAAYRRALGILDSGPEADRILRTSILNNLGVALLESKRYDAAEAVHREVLADREREKGSGHFSVAQSLINLALVSRARSRIQEAAPFVERALGILEATYGHEHPTVAEALSLRAEIDAAAGRLAEAEAGGRETLRIREATLGGAHPETADAQLRLAGLLADRGKLEEAASLAEAALAAFTAIGEGAESRERETADILRARREAARIRSLLRSAPLK